MTPIAVANADPVALATEALVRAETDARRVHAAAGWLLAAGVSLRKPLDGEVMIKFASGAATSTTIRWVQTPSRSEEVSVDNGGQPYSPRGIRQSPLGDPKLGSRQTTTLESVKTLMRAADASRVWLMAGFQSTGLKAQQKLANLQLHLYRQLTRWAETWNADKPGRTTSKPIGGKPTLETA